MISSPIFKEQFLSIEECDYIIWLTESQPDWDSVSNSPYDNRMLDFFTSLQYRRYSSSALQKLSMQIYRKTQDVILKASKKENVNVDFMAIVRMMPGDQTMSHNFNYPNAERVGGCVIFLNDNFDGGLVRFVNTNKTITPHAGAAYVCGVQETDLHIATPVDGGVRYVIISTWTTNPMSEFFNNQITKMTNYIHACDQAEQPSVRQIN